MSNDSIQEKRQSKRYLCDEFFVNCSLQTQSENLDLTAIDFNKEGIGLFSNDLIPESGNVTLSFHYNNPALNHEFISLPCSVVYCNQTEVGSHCGLSFKLPEFSETDRSVLEAIEKYLIKFDDPDNRYHLFGDD